uniref:Uncharacterized protein n=1 Tax=Lygus hesperus TaxID=30085 RepID=A0A146L7Y6_LYGHE
MNSSVCAGGGGVGSSHGGGGPRVHYKSIYDDTAVDGTVIDTVDQDAEEDTATFTHTDTCQHYNRNSHGEKLLSMVHCIRDLLLNRNCVEFGLISAGVFLSLGSLFY